MPHPLLHTISICICAQQELENFKSYAGVKEIGPFHKCFSAVVGPNGSGKSNVIDAMLFVFGKRAKKLRLNKVSELIHQSDAVRRDPPTMALPKSSTLARATPTMCGCPTRTWS
jgi:DNA repair ATPase RecN